MIIHQYLVCLTLLTLMVNALQHKATEAEYCPPPKECVCNKTTDEDEEASSQSKPPVAFTVEMKSKYLTPSSSRFAFDQVLNDFQDSFESPGSSFVCPDDDFYVFMWTLFAKKGEFTAMLMKDGEAVKYGPTTDESDSSDSGSLSMTSTVQCTKGSRIWVKSVGFQNVTFLDSYSSFTGFKIMKKLENFDENQAAFTVELSKEQRYEERKQICYDQVVLNKGKFYNTFTGEFRCPASGMFLFTLSAYVKDGCQTFRIFDGDFPFYDPATYSGFSGTATGTDIGYCRAGTYLTVRPESRRVECDDRGYLPKLTNSLTAYMLHDQNQSTVSFKAQILRSKYVLAGNAIPFESTYIYGNGAGQFYLGGYVCPDNDVYLFTWSVCTKYHSLGRKRKTSSNVEVSLMMDGNGRKKLLKRGARTKKWKRENRHGPQASTQAVARCEKGRIVYLEAVTFRRFDIVLLDEKCTSFVGFRLPDV